MPYLRGFTGLGNFIDLFTDPSFWNTVRVSMVYTFATVIVELLLGLGIALLLRERTRLNNFISIALLMPLMTAPAITALMWKLMTNPSFGVLSWLIALFGVTGFKWASDPSSAMFTVVIVDTWVYTPFIMILLLAGLRSLPQQPFEAARLDGVPAAFMFFRITFADGDALHLHRRAILAAQFDPAVRHHLRDDPGRAGRQPAGVPSPVLPRILPVHQCRPLGGDHGRAVGDHLCLVAGVREAMAQARERAHGGA